MKRNIQRHILEDLTEKIVLVSGSKQAGKTTMSKKLCSKYDYFNYDSGEDRLLLQKKEWDRTRELLIFDELHKGKVG